MTELTAALSNMMAPSTAISRSRALGAMRPISVPNAVLLKSITGFFRLLIGLLSMTFN